MDFLLTPLALLATTEAAKFAGQAIGSGIIGGRADGLLSKATSTFGARVREARRRGHLPQNHHLERGTSRAALLATEVTLQQFIDDHGREPLADWLPEDEDEVDEGRAKAALNKARELFTRNYVGLSALQNQLAVLTRQLQPTKEDDNRSKRFNDALDKARLSPSGSAMDSFGLSALDAQNPAEVQQSHDPSLTIREAREQYLVTMADEVMAQIIRFGNWPTEYRDGQIVALLRPYFFGPEERWAENFALCYAEEIRTDEKLNKLAVLLRAERQGDALKLLAEGDDAIRAQVTAFSDWVEGAFDEQVTLLRSVDARMAALEQVTFELLQEVSAQLKQSNEYIFFPPRMSAKSSAHANFRPFHFAEQEDKFLGREDVIDSLRERLLAKPQGDPDFRWAAICGEAGTGKSRLSLQILKEFAGDWPTSGFVRQSFIRRAHTELQDLSFITGPTLFVVDYTGIMPGHCSQFIERCAALTKQARHPVRLIVLVRRTNDRFFTEIDRSEDEELARDTQVQFDSEDTSKALVLDGFDRTDTVTLMKRRIERIREKDFGGKPLDPMPGDPELLRVVERYDKRRRPLFVLMVADALAREEIDLTSSKSNSEEARLELFWDYLTRQYNRRWRAVRAVKTHAKDDLTDDDKKAIDRHLTLVTLSTMCRGLSEDGWGKLIDNDDHSRAARQLLPEFIDDCDPAKDCTELDEGGLLANIAGSQRNDPDEDPFPILEPDLIGESLFLLMLDDRGKAIAELTKTQRQRQRSLIDLAWVAAPADAAFFTVSCAEDYPETVAGHGFFLPKNKRPEDALLRANLFADLASLAVRPLASAPPAVEDVERIERVLGAFPFEPEAPSDAQIVWAEAFYVLSDNLQFMINRTAPPDSTRMKRKLLDKRENGTSIGDTANKTFESARKELKLSSVTSADAGDDDSLGDTDFLLPPDGNSKAADAAIPVLKGMFSTAIVHAFEDHDPKVRLLFANAISCAIGSVFWNQRSVAAHNGMASKRQTREEEKIRDDFIQSCQEWLKLSEVDETTVAIAARCQSSNIYAQVQSPKPRGDVEFEAIQAINKASGFSRADLIASVLFFMGNYTNSWLIAKEKAFDKELDEKMAAILEQAKLLFQRAIELDDLKRRDAKLVADAWFRVLANVRYHDRMVGRSLVPLFGEELALYRRFIDQHSCSETGRGIASYFTQLLSSVKPNSAEFDLLIDAYLDLVESTDFDRRSFYVRAANNFPWLVHTLIEVSPMDRPRMKDALVKAISQIGPAARDTLVGGLIEKYPSATRDTDWLRTLAEMALEQVEPAIAEQQRRRLENAVTAQLLLEGFEDEVHAQALAQWDDPDAVTRIDGLARVKLMLELLDIEDERIGMWSDKLRVAVTRFLVRPEDIERGSNEARFSEELMTTVASLIEKQIIAGHNPDGWIEILEQAA